MDSQVLFVRVTLQERKYDVESVDESGVGVNVESFL
jgi:hypothetical protein